jgi:hypothetical protein
MHSQASGDYYIYVFVYPFTRTTGAITPQTPVSGSANLCTPKGEQFSMTLGGGMPPYMHIDTQGQPIHLSMSNWQEIYLGAGHGRPNIELYGRWGKAEITADDHQSLSAAFLRNGTVRPPASHLQPADKETIQVTLHEGSFSQWKAACRALQH